MRKLVLAACLVLGACAPTVVGLNDTGGFVKNVRDTNDRKAFKMADDYCKERGLVAHLDSRNIWRNQMTFSCVTPPKP